MKNHYHTAYQFLLDKIPHDHPSSILDEYLGSVDEYPDNPTLNSIYKQLLSSAQNANMKAGVIGGSIGGFKNLGEALYSFNPRKVLRKFDGKPDDLLQHISETLNPNGKVRTGTKSIWPRYCRTILSAASFLQSFKSGSEFVEWATAFYSDARTMPALPLVLATEIDGIGYALACDFLKEFGFTNFGKPDVHIREIFIGLGLCHDKATPYQIQQTISSVAAEASVSAYDADKVFWLVGSGKFYKHPDIGNNGHIGRMKDEFIKLYGVA